MRYLTVLYILYFPVAHLTSLYNLHTAAKKHFQVYTRNTEIHIKIENSAVILEYRDYKYIKCTLNLLFGSACSTPWHVA